MEEEKKKLCAQYLLPSCDITPRKPLDRCNMSETSHSGSTEGLQQTLHVWSSRHDPSHVDAQTHRETSYATTWWIYYSNSSCSACSVHHGNTASMHHGTNVSHFTEKGICVMFRDKQVINTQHTTLRFPLIISDHAACFQKTPGLVEVSVQVAQSAARQIYIQIFEWSHWKSVWQLLVA